MARLRLRLARASQKLLMALLMLQPQQRQRLQRRAGEKPAIHSSSELAVRAIMQEPLDSLQWLL